jgi:hypothetical protein
VTNLLNVWVKWLSFLFTSYRAVLITIFITAKDVCNLLNTVLSHPHHQNKRGKITRIKSVQKNRVWESNTCALEYKKNGYNWNSKLIFSIQFSFLSSTQQQTKKIYKFSFRILNFQNKKTMLFSLRSWLKIIKFFLLSKLNEKPNPTCWNINKQLQHRKTSLKSKTKNYAV